MSKVEYIALRTASLSNLEVAQINATTLTAIKKLNISFKDVPEIYQTVKKMEEALKHYEDMLHQEQPVSAKVLADMDKKRAIDLRNLILSISIAQSSRNAVKKVSADELFTVVKGFKYASKENYEKETALIRQLLNYLEKEAVKEKINQIGVREVVENLKASQDEFYQMYLSYNKYKKKGNNQVLKEKRKSLLKIYTNFYLMLTTIVTIDDKSKLVSVLTAVNNVRRDYAERLKRRKKKLKTASEPENELTSEMKNQLSKDIIQLEEKVG